MIMVIWNMVIFLRISKYGNIAYGNVFRNYYHIWIPKYGKKNLCLGVALSNGSRRCCVWVGTLSSYSMEGSCGGSCGGGGCHGYYWERAEPLM